MYKIDNWGDKSSFDECTSLESRLSMHMNKGNIAIKKIETDWTKKKALIICYRIAIILVKNDWNLLNQKQNWSKVGGWGKNWKAHVVSLGHPTNAPSIN